MIYGKTEGVAPKHLKILERLTKRRSHGDGTVSLEVARIMCSYSLATGRQAAILLSRQGDVEYVISGTPDEIMIPVYTVSPYSRQIARVKACSHSPVGAGR